VGVLIVAVCFVIYAAMNCDSKGCCSCGQTIAKFPWNKLRIPIVAFQIVTQFVGTTGQPLPAFYQRFLGWTDVFNFNLGWLLSLSCVTKINFHKRLLIITASPLVVAGILGFIYAVVAHKLKMYRERNPGAASRRPARLEKLKNRLYLVFLAMPFLIYSTVSTTVLQTFACERVDNVNPSATAQYLRADYSIQCDTDKHKAFQYYAAVMVVVYPFGIPLFYCWLLYTTKHHHINTIKNDAQQESAMTDAPVTVCQRIVQQLRRARDLMFGTDVILSHDPRKLKPELKATKFLWKNYSTGFYYWELIECVRRFLLTGAVVFIEPGTAAQSAIACVLAVFTMVIAMYYRPHADPRDGLIYTAGSLIIFLSMFLSLLMKTDVSKETHDSQKAFAAVLVLLNVMMAAVTFFQVLIVGCRAARTADTPTSQTTTAEQQPSDTTAPLERTASTAAAEEHATNDQSADIEQPRAPIAT
jgi:hypothetical protein